MLNIYRKQHISYFISEKPPPKNKSPFKFKGFAIQTPLIISNNKGEIIYTLLGIGSFHPY